MHLSLGAEAGTVNFECNGRQAPPPRCHASYQVQTRHKLNALLKGIKTQCKLERNATFCFSQQVTEQYSSAL